MRGFVPSIRFARGHMAEQTDLSVREKALTNSEVHIRRVLDVGIGVATGSDYPSHFI